MPILTGMQYLINKGSALLLIFLYAHDISGQITLKFEHHVNGNHIQYDTLAHRNKSGNVYEMNQIQYFISDVTLHGNRGKFPISLDANWRYVDKDIPRMMLWHIDDVPAGKYDSISFTFGFSPERNKSYMFRNPPENLMFWPDALGGGYHYMKLNLKYVNQAGLLSHFNCHLGVGQTKNAKGVTGFIHNDFQVSLPASFEVKKGKSVQLNIVMNVERWFDAVHQVDFNHYPRGIMDNQKAMQTFCENGRHVFDFSLK